MAEVSVTGTAMSLGVDKLPAVAAGVAAAGVAAYALSGREETTDETGETAAETAQSPASTDSSVCAPRLIVTLLSKLFGFLLLM